ncbi:MAG: flagellar hook-associated protein FlgL [Phycisphaerae bacterium]
MGGWGTIYNNTIYSLRHRMDDMSRLQEQVATGNRVNRTSDDPGDAFRILTLQSQSKDFETYRANIDTVNFNLNHVDTNLQMITDDITEVTALLTQAASATYSPDNRKAGGYAVDEIIKGILTNVNANTMGRYLMGGDRINAAPFEATHNEEGQITGVKYVGSDEEMRVPVAPGITSPATLVGSQIFEGNRREPPVFTGDTGAAAGTGTASARGDFRLTLTATGTNVVSANGIAAGPSAAAQGTILGDHTVEIDAASSLIRLDGGEWEYFGGRTDLSDVPVDNEHGDRAYVDLTGWDGTSCTATLQGQGTLSIDGGTTTTPIDFTQANQPVRNADGQVLFVDTTGIQRIGEEAVRISGTFDLFDTLIQIRDLMMNTENLDADEQGARLTAAIDPIKQVMNRVTERMTSVGGRIQAIDALDDSMKGLKASADEQTAQVQQADIAQVATDLAKAQTFYEMTLASSSKLLNMSLLDYL